MTDKELTRLRKNPRANRAIWKAFRTERNAAARAKTIRSLKRWCPNAEEVYTTIFADAFGATEVRVVPGLLETLTTTDAEGQPCYRGTRTGKILYANPDKVLLTLLDIDKFFYAVMRNKRIDFYRKSCAQERSSNPTRKQLSQLQRLEAQIEDACHTATTFAEELEKCDLAGRMRKLKRKNGAALVGAILKSIRKQIRCLEDMDFTPPSTVKDARTRIRSYLAALAGRRAGVKVTRLLREARSYLPDSESVKRAAWDQMKKRLFDNDLTLQGQRFHRAIELLKSLQRTNRKRPKTGSVTQTSRRLATEHN
jgi:hypothetical protein